MHVISEYIDLLHISVICAVIPKGKKQRGVDIDIGKLVAHQCRVDYLGILFVNVYPIFKETREYIVYF
jgi:hypothetical protein